MKNLISVVGALLSVVGLPVPTVACTIFSGVGANGEVWNGNNEDGADGANTFINVFPKNASARFGYYTLSYDNPENGANSNIQGGMNEAGLTFDFNALEHSYEIVGKDKKKMFPKGDSAILPYILANLSTAEEVVAFFDEYWFANGFTSAQMHIADRRGHFALVSPSGSRILKGGAPQVSTNFRLYGGTKEEAAVCWRFPIATEKLRTHEANLDSFTDIASSTAQSGGGGGTLYSNVQNLTTGDIWFYFARDFRTPFKTNVRELIELGRESYSMQDLKGRSGFDDKTSGLVDHEKPPTERD